MAGAKKASGASCGDGDALAFDQENRLKTVNGSNGKSYTYDGDSVRVSKAMTVSGVTTTTTKYYYPSAGSGHALARSALPCARARASRTCTATIWAAQRN